MIQNSSQFNLSRRHAEEILKSNPRGRVNQFEVARRLEGLQEKFQVIGRDELADALRSRLEELSQHHQYTWFPEILSLFLELSDRPALLSSLDRIEASKPQESEPQLLSPVSETLEGVDGDDGNIWEYIDYAAASSDDDLSSVASEVSASQGFPHNPVPPAEDDYVMPEDIFASDEDEDMIKSIVSSQFWRAENKPPPLTGTDKKSQHSQVVTEAQAVKETIFMLHGLPTSLFLQSNDKTVQLDRRYALSHSSNTALDSLLSSFSYIGSEVNSLRRFTHASQTIPYMQTFRRDVEECLSGFDTFLSSIEMQYLQVLTVSVSLLRLLEEVRRETRPLLPLVSLVSNIDHAKRPAQLLDMLYELVCISQATGDDAEFRFLSKLFFSCLGTYMRPIQLWMETGYLDTREGAIFVVRNHNADDLRTLWHEWHTLDEESLVRNVPRFLHSVSPKIFKTGKSVFFLRQLDVLPENLVDLRGNSLTFEDICLPGSPTPFYLSFPELLEGALERLIDANHLAASNALQNELNQRCGLWTSLHALEVIYLCRDMSILSPFDSKVFELIDRGRDAWNDRYLLTELAQSAFNVSHSVDPTRLVVKSRRGSHKGLDSGSRSVNVLEAISIDYTLSWPLANIITGDAIHTYQRIFTFLMQIRRAKHAAVMQRLRIRGALGDDKEEALGYALRHSLLWFLNVLYGHMTDLVISSATESMHGTLAASNNVDSMINAHKHFISSLEEQLLLSEKMAPIYHSVINVLDLCIRFADIQAIHYRQMNFVDRDNLLVSRSRKDLDDLSPLRDVQDDENSDIEDDREENNSTTTISFEESPYAHQLKSVKEQFDQSLAFMTAGLKKVGYVGGQDSWGMLAEKLEWRKPREGSMRV